MKKYRKAILGTVAALAALAVTMTAGGVRLACPEELVGEDQFVGFHLVYQSPLEKVEQSGWKEYGTQDMVLEGFGTVSFPRKILIGRYNEETWEYEFPGLEGQNCFLGLRTEEDGNQSYVGYSGLADAHIVVGDGEYSISGTAYVGPMAENHAPTEDGYVLVAYRVYQMADETIYLTGEGNGYGGRGGFTINEEHNRIETIGGERRQITLEVQFSIEWAERTEEVAVSWYDSDNCVVGERALTMEEIGDGLTLERPEGAVWALVTTADSLGTVARCAYTLDEPGKTAYHRLIQMDERGMGRVVDLLLE